MAKHQYSYRVPYDDVRCVGVECASSASIVEEGNNSEQDPLLHKVSFDLFNCLPSTLLIEAA